MNEHDRLVDLLKEAKSVAKNIILHSTIDEVIDVSYDSLKADYLLENGVVVLPCKREDLYSLRAIRKKCIKGKYAIVRYDCQKNKPFRIVSYEIRGKELLTNEDVVIYDYLPSMNFTVISNGFDTKEEAEQAIEALRGGNENE